MDGLIRERIYNPIVRDVYEEWCERGLLEETESLIRDIPADLVRPFEYNFTTHVGKEKGLFVDLVGAEFGIDEEPRKALALSADILWTLSLMIDDIEDRDIIRGNLETSWVKFGERETLNSAKLIFFKLLHFIENNTGSRKIAEGCIRYVNLGMRSLIEHRFMNLDTSEGVVISNYENRCDFHATYQLMAFSQEILRLRFTERMKMIIAALRYINQSGQLKNDLRNLADNSENRQYTDLMQGVPTIPLIQIYKSLDRRNARYFRSLFGKPYLNQEERLFLMQAITDTQVTEKIGRRINDNYINALELLNSALRPNTVSWFERWIIYKNDRESSFNLSHQL